RTGERGHEPGDIAVAPNGDLFVSDGRAGKLYVVRDGRVALDTLVPAGHLFSPQGIAPDPDGRRLFVADYLYGVAIVDRVTGAVRAGAVQRAPAIARVRVAPRELRVSAANDSARTKTELLAADRALARETARRGSAAFLDALDDDAAVLMPRQPILRGAAEA